MRHHTIFCSYCYYGRYYYRMTTVVTTVATQHGVTNSFWSQSWRIAPIDVLEQRTLEILHPLRSNVVEILKMKLFQKIF